MKNTAMMACLLTVHASGLTPLDKTQRAGQKKNDGDVDKKPAREGDSWGDLSAKERQVILQEITKDLPSHYREVIEQYFRKLARDGAR